MEHVIVNFNVKSDKAAEFVSILNNVKSELPKVEGCLGVKIFRNTSLMNKFTLVETWESKQHHQNHLSTLTEDGTWEFISSHLSIDPESSYFEAI
ncbi:MAG: antibiotic biosynthesis monooxygenase [Ectothiorhodospiraceae bacterium]|nr:antibiotic biosynthesis monooxygenase [Ectothiorhodospiraceae bacterium]